jgi:hypothetical protein
LTCFTSPKIEESLKHKRAESTMAKQASGSSKWRANHPPDHYYKISVDTGISASIGAAV